MKQFFILMLSLLMIVALISCDSKTPETTTTEAPTDKVTEAPTAAPTEEATTEAPTIAEETTEAPATEDTNDQLEWTEPEDVPYTAVDIPIVSGVKNVVPHGYNASGEFSFADGDALSTTDNNMFIVTNDRMATGKLTATFTAPVQDVNDNGIIFGMTEVENDQYYFWEDGATYYFLFVSDNCNLYLAKVSYNGQPWTELHVTAPIYNYQHGQTITISVEFDGEGSIDCYANDEWLISYFDPDWTGGAGYGIRCEVPDVCYSDLIVDHTWVPDW